MKKIILDDGFQEYLVENANLVGEPGIPEIIDFHNTEVPIDIVPFEKINKETNKRKYVHFYMHDKGFRQILTNTKLYVTKLKMFDGVITPDPTIKTYRSKCIQETNTYLNRAVGVYLQKQGIPVIPNIRWGDENSFSFCFLGVPKNSILSVSTHGCIRSNEEKDYFRKGLKAMLVILEPMDVLVHGYMPDEVFGDFLSLTRFHRYKSQFEKTHLKK